MYGCFYYLCSNMWKRIQQSGLQERYINDPEFALHLRMISALAFLPPNDVQNSFDQLAALIRNQYGNATDGVLDYFEDNYVGRFRVNAPRGFELQEVLSSKSSKSSNISNRILEYVSPHR